MLHFWRDQITDRPKVARVEYTQGKIYHVIVMLGKVGCALLTGTIIIKMSPSGFSMAFQSTGFDNESTRHGYFR